MSGGHWDYNGRKIQAALEDLCDDAIVRERWPTLGQLLEGLGQELHDIEHDMDWDVSGDKSIEDDKSWEKQRIAALLVNVMKAAPDEWFPRGKWATIQAVQQRSGQLDAPACG